MTHGAKTRLNTSAAAAPSFDHGNFWRRARNSTKRKLPGNRVRIAAFVRTEKPQNPPHAAQARTVPFSSRTYVAHTQMETNSAERLVSQIHSTGKNTACGRRAHSHPARTPVGSPHKLFPMRKRK